MKVRAYLLMMAIAILVPIVASSAVALHLLLSSEREMALKSLQESSRAAALLIDKELSSAEAALRVLAKSPHLIVGDLPHFYEHAKTADRGEEGRTILFAANGQQIINTVIPLGSPLPPPPPHVTERTRQVIASQKTVVSGLIIGAVQQKPVTTINIPVPIEEGKRFVLGSVFGTEYFQKLILAQNLNPAWNIAVIDGAGKFIARRQDFSNFLGRAANPVLLEKARLAPEGQFRTADRKGVDSYYSYTRSPISGWTVWVSAPTEEIEAAAQKAAATAIIGMLVALLCAAAAAILFGRRLIGAIRGASLSAASLGHGRVPETVKTGIIEFNALQSIIHEAGKKLAQSESERSQLLAKEQDARQHAEQQNILKDQFLAMLGHELRNPLSGIAGAVELMETPGVDEAMLSRARQILARQSENLKHIVDDLLDLARVSTGKINLALQPIELSAVVRSAMETFEAAGKIEHQVAVQLEPVWISADRTRLDQIVNNLLSNAFKYTPAGGTIIVTVCAKEDEAVFSVQDSGVGISKELIPRIFDIFVQGSVTLDRSQGGLGIGLSLVKHLVTLHGGRIDVSSPGPNQGSTFVVSFPRHSGYASSNHSSLNENACSNKSCTILLIEDNDDARQVLSAKLRLHGYEVWEADDGLAGVELALKVKPSVGIIDIGLPGLDGYQIARRLRADPGTGMMLLIALTGYGQESDKRQAFEAGFDTHLVKPVNWSQLMETIRQCPPSPEMEI